MKIKPFTLATCFVIIIIIIMFALTLQDIIDHRSSKVDLESTIIISNVCVSKEDTNKDDKLWYDITSCGQSNKTLYDVYLKNVTIRIKDNPWIVYNVHIYPNELISIINETKVTVTDITVKNINIRNVNTSDKDIIGNIEAQLNLSDIRFSWNSIKSDDLGNVYLDYAWLNLPDDEIIVENAKFIAYTKTETSNTTVSNNIISNKTDDLKEAIYSENRTLNDSTPSNIDDDSIKELLPLKENITNETISNKDLSNKIDYIKIMLPLTTIEINRRIYLREDVPIKSTTLDIDNYTPKSASAISENIAGNITSTTEQKKTSSENNYTNLFINSNATSLALENNYFKPIISILYFIGKVVLVVIIVSMLLFRILPLSWLMIFGKADITIETLEMAYKDESLEKSLTGMSEILIERLISQSKYVNDKISAHSNPKRDDPSEFMRLSKDTPKQTLPTIITSLSDANPDTYTKNLLKLFGAILPPKGINVKGILQRKGNAPYILGITFNISDKSERSGVRIHTFWEEENSFSQSTACMFDDETRAEMLQRVSEELDKLALLEDAIKSLKYAQKLNINSEDKEKIKANIGRLENRENVLNKSIELYNTAEAFQKKQENEDALENYMESLIKLFPDDIILANRIKQLFIEMFKLTDPLDDETKRKLSLIYSELGEAYYKGGLWDISHQLFLKSGILSETSPSNRLKQLQENRIEGLITIAKLTSQMNMYPEAKRYSDMALKLIVNNTADAKKALQERIDKEIPTLTSDIERYERIVNTATIWMALEIARMRLLERSPFKVYFNHNAYQSKVDNFTGASHLFFAQKDGGDFFSYSREYLENAVNHCDSWYQPHENLGLWYTLKGQNDTYKNAVELYKKAVLEYETALANAIECKTLMSFGNWSWVLPNEVRPINCSKDQRKRQFFDELITLQKDQIDISDKAKNAFEKCKQTDKDLSAPEKLQEVSNKTFQMTQFLIAKGMKEGLISNENPQYRYNIYCDDEKKYCPNFKFLNTTLEKCKKYDNRQCAFSLYIKSKEHFKKDSLTDIKKKIDDSFEWENQKGMFAKDVNSDAENEKSIINDEKFSIEKAIVNLFFENPCNFVTSDEQISIRNRINISKAIACVLSKDTSLSLEGKKLIKNIDQSEFIFEETSARSLYNLACWYAITKKYPLDTIDNKENTMEWKARARICLAHALARDKDKNLWNVADEDQDLKEVREGLADLKFELARQLDAMPEMLDDKEAFKIGMAQVFINANWHDVFKDSSPYTQFVKL